ncbi:Hypothetical protein SCLAV_1163 [Streptomyces clavuligerus]|uniref:Uncharacterized protein n=1 Tax=Streptomyces clavuligerus TaxID=1901 RepID=E2PYL9_STRCL|nr:Hypothetical protein SCLAV_1163 [Streptomyces clavuligerus]
MLFTAAWRLLYAPLSGGEYSRPATFPSVRISDESRGVGPSGKDHSGGRDLRQRRR